jgi:hypothetical protein
MEVRMGLIAGNLEKRRGMKVEGTLGALRTLLGLKNSCGLG